MSGQATEEDLAEERRRLFLFLVFGCSDTERHAPQPRKRKKTEEEKEERPTAAEDCRLGPSPGSETALRAIQRMLDVFEARRNVRGDSGDMVASARRRASDFHLCAELGDEVMPDEIELMRTAATEALFPVMLDYERCLYVLGRRGVAATLWVPAANWLTTIGGAQEAAREYVREVFHRQRLVPVYEQFGVLYAD
jgi:hypothetical protein